jgi:5-formyltetrahydrofolate cyclo-ligase
VYPRVVADTDPMDFHPLPGGAATEQGPGRVRQPTGHSPAVALSQIDVIFLPLVGCDAQGTRLGYGGGYYDRVLAESNALRVGIGFALQRIDSLPTEIHDQPLDMFVCENGVETFAQ